MWLIEMLRSWRGYPQESHLHAPERLCWGGGEAGGTFEGGFEGPRVSAAIKGSLLPVRPQGNHGEFVGREVRPQEDEWWRAMYKTRLHLWNTCPIYLF